MKIMTMTCVALLLASSASAATYRIKAAGLNCNFCAFTIERLLGKIAGVDKKSIDVEVKTGLVSVASRDDAFVAPQRLKEAIEKGGYSYRSMELAVDGRFVSADGKLAFQPTGAKEPLALTETPKGAADGVQANIHAAVEFSAKGQAALKVEHFAPVEKK